MWIIATAPNSAGESLLVNLSDSDKHAEGTTICLPGEHPWLKKSSAVLYAQAEIKDTAALAKHFQSGKIERLAPCSLALLQRIREGFVRSNFFGGTIRTQCAKHWPELL